MAKNRGKEGRATGRAGPALAAAALAALLLAYLLLGRYPGPGFSPPRSFVEDPVALRILLAIRLPRALAAILLGAALGGAGAVFQLVFGNPLVEPGFLGVSQGASLGAAIAVVAGLASPWAVSAAAFVLALLGLRLSLLLASRFRFGGQVLRLVLAGIVVSAFLSAALSLTKYAADPLSQLPDIVFWTMGSLASATWPRVLVAAAIVAPALAFLLATRWRATILSLDDESARALGARPERDRALLVGVATAGVAAVTAMAGTVSWIGLVVPHVARLLAGADGRGSVPASMALGAGFALACDGLARTLLPGELPLGIPTALVGALSFALILASRRAGVAR